MNVPHASLVLCCETGAQSHAAQRQGQGRASSANVQGWSHKADKLGRKLGTYTTRENFTAAEGSSSRGSGSSTATRRLCTILATAAIRQSGIRQSGKGLARSCC